MNKVISALAVSTMITTGIFAQETKTEKTLNLSELTKKVTQNVSDSAIDTAFKALPEVLGTYGNNQKIMREDIAAQIKKYIQPGQQIDPSKIKDMIKQLVEQKAVNSILLEVATKAGFKADEAAVENQLKQALENPMASQILTAQGITQEELKKEMTNGNIINQWFEKEVLSKIKISEEDVKKFYDENLSQYFTEPAGRSISHILIRNEDDAKAKSEIEAIAKQLKDNAAAFETIAAEKSACPSGKEAKGSIGVVADNAQNIDQDFLSAAQKLKVGEISAPVKTQFGYHIIRVDSIKDKPTEIPFETVKENIKNFLEQGKASQEAAEQKIEELKKEYNYKLTF